MMYYLINKEVKTKSPTVIKMKFFDIDNLPGDITPLCVPIMRDLKKSMLTGG
jgi:hypothetical protein